MQFMPILANLLCVMSYNYGLYKDVVFVAAEFMSIFANVARKGGRGERHLGLEGTCSPIWGEILEFRF